MSESIEFIEKEDTWHRADGILDFTGQGFEHVALVAVFLAIGVAGRNEGDVEASGQS